MANSKIKNNSNIENIGLISNLNTLSYRDIYTNYVGYVSTSTQNRPDNSGGGLVLLSSTNSVKFGSLLYITDRSLYRRVLSNGVWGSWVDIQKATSIQTATPTTNTSVIPQENNFLKLVKFGNIVQLSGYFAAPNDIPTYEQLFDVPNGFKPYKSLSLTPLNSTTITWLFLTERGDCATQNKALPSGNHYLSCVWITSQD